MESEIERELLTSMQCSLAKLTIFGISGSEEAGGGRVSSIKN